MATYVALKNGVPVAIDERGRMLFVVTDRAFMDLCKPIYQEQLDRLGCGLESLWEDIEDDCPSSHSSNTETKGEHDNVLEHFKTSWLHPPSSGKQLPSVSSITIIQLDVPQSAFLAYQATKAGAPRHGSAKTGNTLRRFHGTKCAASCRLSPSCRTPCSDSSCAACCIGRSGFKVSKSAATGRFGRGIYFTATSSKAYDYTAANTSGYLVIIVADVVCGRAHVSTTSWWNSDTAPPSGYDSVVGDPKTTADVNYDEVVVYRDDACLPRFMLLIPAPSRS